MREIEREREKERKREREKENERDREIESCNTDYFFAVKLLNTKITTRASLGGRVNPSLSS